MKTKQIILAVAILFLTSSCYAEMTGTVVDAETGKPIEGAVMLVVWTKTKGLGLTYTETYKVIEVVTDKAGQLKVSKVYNPFVNPPYITIYKKGYVAWNNKFIFPDYRKREDFKWQRGYVFKMERFKNEYTYSDHVSFMGTATLGDWGKIFKKAIRLEELKRSEEWEAERKKGN